MKLMIGNRRSSQRVKALCGVYLEGPLMELVFGRRGLRARDRRRGISRY